MPKAERFSKKSSLRTLFLVEGHYPLIYQHAREGVVYLLNNPHDQILKRTFVVLKKKKKTWRIMG